MNFNNASILIAAALFVILACAATLFVMFIGIKILINLKHLRTTGAIANSNIPVIPVSKRDVKQQPKTLAPDNQSDEIQESNPDGGDEDLSDEVDEEQPKRRSLWTFLNKRRKGIISDMEDDDEEVSDDAAENVDSPESFEDDYDGNIPDFEYEDEEEALEA